MKTINAVLIVVLNTVSAMSAFGQTPDITSFDHNGQIEWTNSVIDGAYRIEWAPSLSNGRWLRSWQSLSDVESTSNGVMAARVPMFFRVVGMTNRSPAGMALVDAGTFLMGNPDTNAPSDADESPIHSVFISAFFIDKFEVSNERMRQVLQWAYDHGKITATPSTVTNLEGDQQQLLDLRDWLWEDPRLPGFPHHSQIKFSDGLFHVEPGKEGHPATCVSWFGAQA